MDGQLVAVLRHAHEVVDLGTIESGIDALAEHVHGERDETDIAGALAIAEECALDAVGPRHQAELGGRHRRAAVIVRVERYDDAVAVLHIAAEPLDLVGMNVRRCDFDGVRQIEDQLLLRCRIVDIHHRLADLF